MSRSSVIIAFAAVCALASPALAYENFIPLGTGYSTDVSSLPKFSSEADEVNMKADMYESEIYRRALSARELDTRMMLFRTDKYNVKSDNFIDY